MTSPEPAQSDEESDASKPRPGGSSRGLALAVAGCIGVLASVGLAMSVLFETAPLSLLAAALIYVAGFVALVLLTAGRAGESSMWLVRLAGPIPGALAVWAVLAAIGV